MVGKCQYIFDNPNLFITSEKMKRRDLLPIIKEIGIDSKDLISKLEEEIQKRVAISDLNKLNRDLGKLIPKMKEKIKKHHRMSPMALSVSIEFVSSSARVTSVKFAKVAQFVRDNRIHRSDQGHLGPIKTQASQITPFQRHKYFSLILQKASA